MARVADRVGKGIRGAPHDAMAADLTPHELRGAAFGLRQSLDSFGAFAGPVMAIGLRGLTAIGIRGVLRVACVPAALAVGLLMLGIAEPRRAILNPHKAGFGIGSARHLAPLSGPRRELEDS